MKALFVLFLCVFFSLVADNPRLTIPEPDGEHRSEMHYVQYRYGGPSATTIAVAQGLGAFAGTIVGLPIAFWIASYNNHTRAS
jgi:hypothetical protein